MSTTFVEIGDFAGPLTVIGAGAALVMSVVAAMIVTEALLGLGYGLFRLFRRR